MRRHLSASLAMTCAENWRRDLGAHLRGDVGVAVAVRPDPAAGVEERRADRGHRAGGLAQDPVVEAAIDHRNRIEQGVIEDVDDGVGFLDGRGLLQRDGARAHERIDLLQHMALVFHEVGTTQAAALLEQARDAADLALDGATARLGGMRGEDGVELQALEQLARAALPHLVDETAVGDGELVGGVDGRIDRDVALASAQRRDAVALLGKVGQVEERGEGADHDLRTVERERVDQLDGLAEGIGGSAARGGDALGVGLLVGGLGARIALVGADRGAHELVEDVADVGVVFAQDATLEAQEQREMVA